MINLLKILGIESELSDSEKEILRHLMSDYGKSVAVTGKTTLTVSPKAVRNSPKYKELVEKSKHLIAA